MARKQKPPDAPPSKAYLLSFGDTMTALLAFFIVLNSLAKEQTGANMHTGTGSFVNAFSKSGTAGMMPGNRSANAFQKKHHAPIYALAENLDKNEGNVGPDNKKARDRIVDADKARFQKFLEQMDKDHGLESKPPTVNQVAFDSFVPFNRQTGAMSDHAIQLAAEIIPKLRNSSARLDIVVWATVPSKSVIDRQMKQVVDVKKEIGEKFWLKENEQRRIRYAIKPWLFSDAKRPIVSFVFSETKDAAN